jgi:hypothetical protein
MYTLLLRRCGVSSGRGETDHQYTQYRFREEALGASVRALSVYLAAE